MNIIINGSEMVEILGGSPLEFSKVVQLDGIYRINAEVKEIEKVEDHNCLFAMT